MKVTIDGVGITYDALGRMVEQNRSGAYTQIVYAPSGGKLALMNGSTLQKGFVPLTGGAMAVYNASGLAYYRHSDWLGSSRLASTPSRTIFSDGAYAPFGEPYAQAGASDLSFTGMNQDTVSNLYDFPAREYGIQGRWPSPDPAGIAAVSPGDPQTWNAYAYVRNNPLALTDLTGLRMTLSEHGGGGDGGPFWGYDDEEGGFDWGWSEDYGWGSGSGGGYGWGPLIAVPPDTWGLIINNWTGSDCDPSVPDCGATINCPDDGSGPCTISTTTTCGDACTGNTGGASGSWDSAPTSWWGSALAAAVGPWTRWATRNVPGVGRPFRPSPLPDLRPMNEPPPNIGPIGTDIPGSIGPSGPINPNTPGWQRLLYLFMTLISRVPNASIIVIIDPCRLPSEKRLPLCPNGPIAELPETKANLPTNGESVQPRRGVGNVALPRLYQTKGD